MIGEKESSEDLPKAYFITTCTRDNRLDDSICVQEIINDLDISKMNSLNPENSPIAAATGRAGEREIRKSNSRITKFPEKKSKNFILLKRKSA